MMKESVFLQLSGILEMIKDREGREQARVSSQYRAEILQREQ